MARGIKGGKAQDVTARTHRRDRRKNIPTAEFESYLQEEEAKPKPKLYQRNPDLDPQLVWRGKDPYDKLKRTLKAEIDERAWSTLHRTVSRPFPRPQSGKIAVKVINHYGDEVLKVYQIP